MNVFVLGASGLLGHRLTELLTRDGSISSVYVNQHCRPPQWKNKIEFNLNNVDSMAAVLDKSRVSLVINCIGMTNVEACESDPVKANEINAFIPERLARACVKSDCSLIHISTDHLWRGNLALSSEASPKDPVNRYASSKSLGEELVLNSNSSALIARTNFYGWGLSHRVSFSDFIVQSLRDRRNITLFNDVFYSPIYIENLAERLIKLFSLGERGIFNVCGDERVSKYDFGLRLARYFGLDEKLLLAGSISDRKDLIIRPKDMSLSSGKYLERTGDPSISLEEGFFRLKKDEAVHVAS